MKRTLFTLIFTVFLISFISAEITINQQPKLIYNLGEEINLPITVTSENGIYDYLKIYLSCDNRIHFLPEEEISLAQNEKMEITKSIFLIDKFIGNSLGSCKIKAWLQDSPGNFVFSNEFQILNSIEVELEMEKTEFNPGETVFIKGTTTKDNRQPVNGFVELSIVSNDYPGNKTYNETITDGVFLVSFDLSETTGAGKYSLKINAYEKGPLDKITNKGVADINIQVNQVPTSLEISFENTEVEPGTNLKVKAILHDQTGEKINSNAIISIKDGNDRILEQIEKPTDEFLEFPILYNEPSAEWSIVAVSAKLSSEASFKIIEKQELKAEIINKTLILTNIGNVPYNESIIVKIGNESVTLNSILEVDEVKKYTLFAPDGEYIVEILAKEESKASKSVLLTGDAIGIKEASSIISSSKFFIVFLFMIFIMGFIAFMIFKKGQNKTFFGRIASGKKNIKPIFSKTKKNLLNTKNKAELSLSLSGEKQKANVVCLNIKNLKEIEKNLKSVKETFGKIDNLIDKSKIFVYENNENLFFIFSPIMTKTFDNEKSTLELAQKIEKLLREHNKLFRQRIDFGISLNSGEIISKKEGDILKFMSFGNLIINAKKIASLSDSEIYLNEEIKNKIASYAKIEKNNEKGTDFYKIKEMKKNEDHKKFISEFIKRLERDKKSKG